MDTSGRRFLWLFEGRRDHPVIVAHRGDSYHAPENTLEAARLARQVGADAWELDVQLTRDGVAVVMHDESLIRTTDVATQFAGDPRGRTGFRVSEFDFAEIRTLDAGSWFVDPRGGPRSAHSFGTLDRLDPARARDYASGNVRVPCLAEALLLTRELDWLVNVELKTFTRSRHNLVTTVLDALRSTNTAELALVSSFDHVEVAAAIVSGRRYAVGILAETRLHRLADYAGDLVGADTVHVATDVLSLESMEAVPHDEPELPEDDIVTALKRRRIPLLVYTVNETGHGSASDQLAAIGVDGLFTDDPAGLAEYFHGRRRA
jgi:glycerophosphoryl diester phosphodiesterase